MVPSEKAQWHWPADFRVVVFRIMPVYILCTVGAHKARFGRLGFFWVARFLFGTGRNGVVGATSRAAQAW